MRENPVHRNRHSVIRKTVGLTVATSLVFMTPVAPYIANFAKEGEEATSVVYAQSQNLLERTSDSFYIGHHWDNSVTRHTLTYGGFATLDLDTQSAITYIVQLPNELAFVLNDEETVARTISEFDISGYALDSNGEQFSLTRIENLSDYLSVNNATNSFEFDLRQLMVDHNLSPIPDNYYGFNFRLVTPYKGLPNGNYEIRAALTEGTTDLSNVSNAFSGTLRVDYHDGDEPDANKEELEALLQSIYEADYQGRWFGIG